jgi:hypothetical protein
MTIVRKCNCQNEYQNARYGPGQRVKNAVAVPKGQPPRYRCTVCGKVE